MDAAVGGFVGRAAEVQFLTARLDRAGAGVGGLVRITGVPGIGKTALAHLVVPMARDRGFDVAWSSCWQTAVVPALWPWTQLLWQLAGPGGAAPDLAVTAIQGADEGVEVARAEQAERVARWLRGRGDRPALLVLDDLHWADAGTLLVLDHVAAALPVSPLVVVATARPATEASPYAEVLARPQRFGEEVVLAGLDAADSASLIASSSGVTPSAEVVRAVVTITGGNPLFVREIGRGLEAAQLTGPVDVDALATERSVADLIAERLTHLGAEARRLLNGLSVAGDEVPWEVLAAITGNSAPDALEVVDEVRRAGLVEHDENGGVVRFAHALFRAAVHELLSLSDRARWHDTIGRALLERRAAGSRVDAAALAHHFGRSAPLGNGALALEFALEAAHDAVDVLAFDVAVRRLEQADALITMDATLGERLPILLELADALAAAGDTDRARATFLDAATAARAVGDAEDLGRAALGYSGGVAGIETIVGDRAVCALLAEAAAALDGDLVLGPLVEARRSVALSFLAPIAERRALAARACDRARRGGDPATIAQTVAAWIDVIAGPDHVAERRAAAEEIIDQSVRIGDARGETLGRRLLVEALVEVGDLAAAGAEVARYESAAARLGRPEHGWYPALWRAALAFARGDLEAQRRHRADLDAAATGGMNAVLLSTVHEVATAFDLDDRDALPGLLDRIAEMDLPLDVVQFRCTIALVRALATDGRETGEPLGPLIADGLAADRDSEWLPMLVQLAEVAILVGARAEAEVLRRALAPHGAVWSIEGIAAGIRGPADRIVGRLAALVGDTDAARVHFDAARSATDAAGAHLLSAVIDHERGVALDEPERVVAAAAALRAMGAPSRRGVGDEPLPATANRFALDGDSWSIEFGGTTTRLRDSKGLRDLGRLLAEPGREIAALDLIAPGPTLHEAGTGAALDAQARAAYAARLRDLEGDLDGADADGDLERSARLAAERDALIEQLTGAYGLGGRARSAGGSAERARTAVRARIRDALGRIEAGNPALGRHLQRSVRTGTFCVYDPDEPVDWER